MLGRVRRTTRRTAAAASVSDVRRFLFVIHYPVYGGPHNQALRLAGPLRERGWETLVLLPDEPGNAVERLQAAGIETVALPLGRFRASPTVRPYIRMVRDFRADINRIRRVIHSRHIDLVLIGGLVNPHGALAARGLPTAVVWQILDTRAPVVLRRLAMPFVARMADAVMSTGLEVARVHPGTIGLGDRLVPYLPPVDTEEFAPNPTRRDAARAELGLSGSDLVVGTVGNLSPMKGHLTFIRAAASLRRRYPHVRFALLGAAFDDKGGYTKMLFDEAQSLGLQLGEDLIVVDPGARVAQLAPAFDVFWLSSEQRSEGIPMAVAEAMALAVPVVASSVGGVPEIVADGATGFLVPPGDPAALAAATAPLLEDEALRRRLGERARARALAEFALDRCADTHVEAFERALEHRAGTLQGRTGRRLVRGDGC